MQQQQVNGQKILEQIQQQRNQALDEIAQLKAYIQQLEEQIKQKQEDN